MQTRSTGSQPFVSSTSDRSLNPLQLVIHIVPQLPPQNSGVGDYAMLVGHHMEQISDGVECRYVAAGHSTAVLPASGERVRNITGRCEPGTLWRVVDELVKECLQKCGGLSETIATVGRPKHVDVVLHYSGYGYDRNSCPAWIVKTLRERPNFVRQVITFFHELYATSPPWQRAFWYSFRQRRIAVGVARLSDFLLTNREQSARWLEKVTGCPIGSATTLAVPSNVGEPTEVPKINLRPRRAVTFGGADCKRFALLDEAPQVSRLLRQMGISELIDIGSDCPVDAQSFNRSGISVQQLGYRNASEVSDNLLQCRVGFLDYPLAVVAKSGVFAAFAAHGVVPILRRHKEGTFDRITISEHALTMPSAIRSKLSEMTLQRISDAARASYRDCSLNVHASTILQVMLQSEIGRVGSGWKPDISTAPNYHH
jgi:hypothetical protein